VEALHEDVKEEEDHEFEIEGIVPKFNSLETRAAVEKLQNLAKFLYFHCTTNDKYSFLVKACVKDYIYSEHTKRAVKPSTDKCRLLLD
jgi:hypothetical protein